VLAFDRIAVIGHLTDIPPLFFKLYILLSGSNSSLADFGRADEQKPVRAGWPLCPQAEGDYLANLLPIYGHFAGEPHQGIPPTGKWLECAMVNVDG
jgi:hypothetical protein